MRKRTDIAMAYLTKEQKEHAMQIAARIDAIIAKPEIVKGDFYKESGVSSATLSQWRNGTYYPSQKKLADAAEYLNVSVKYLEYGNEPQKEKPTAQGGELISDLPEDIQKIISLCLQNPNLAAALLNLAQQMQNPPAVEA